MIDTFCIMLNTLRLVTGLGPIAFQVWLGLAPIRCKLGGPLHSYIEV